jgi:hypothetical protein
LGVANETVSAETVAQFLSVAAQHFSLIHSRIAMVGSIRNADRAGR